MLEANILPDICIYLCKEKVSRHINGNLLTIASTAIRDSHHLIVRCWSILEDVIDFE